jgi:hypothetical protein
LKETGKREKLVDYRLLFCRDSHPFPSTAFPSTGIRSDRSICTIYFTSAQNPYRSSCGAFGVI